MTPRTPHPAPKPRWHVLLWWLLLPMLGTWSTLSGADYTIQSWRSGHGLQARGISTCMVGRDGMTWIGAIGDLIRFDGLVFERVAFDLPARPSSNRITALWEDARRRIWCGYETGDVVVYDELSRTATLLPLLWSREEVRAIHGDPLGDTWIILDDHSLIRTRDGLSTGPKNIGGRLCFFQTTSGRFLAERGGGIYQWQQDGSWKQVHEAYNYISCAMPAHKEGLWLVNPNWEKAYHVLDDDTLVETRPLPHSLAYAMFIESRNGDLLASMHGEGLYSIGQKGEIKAYTTQEGLASLWINGMAEDNGGNVIAVSYEDISILRQSKASTLVRIQDFGGARLTGVTGGSDGRIWITSEGAGVFRYEDGKLSRSGMESGLNNLNIWSFLQATGNQLWAGSWGGGLYTGVEGRFAPERPWPLPQRRVVTSLIQARDGSVWVGAGEGLGRKFRDAWTWYAQCGQKEIGNVRAIVEDRNGRIWFGTTGNGVGYLRDGNVVLLDSNAQPGSRFVSSLLADDDGGVWVGTEGSGLFNWKDDRWTRLGTEDGLPSNDIFHMANDGHGRLWFTSPAGVFAIPVAELAAVVAGGTDTVHPTTINREDGLPSNQCAGGSQNAAYLGDDGRYFVPTSGGLAVINTSAVQTEKTRLCPSFTRLFVDAKPISVSEGAPVVCPARTQSLRVEFSAPSLTHSELVKYAYMLDGDGQSRWLQLGSNRSLQLQRLAPGRHKLQIIAWSPDSTEDAPVAELFIEQSPTLTETLWFRAVTLVLALSTIICGVWLYTRRSFLQTQRKLELETAIEKERHRIARDIHDELGVLLAQVMLLIQGTNPERNGGEGAGILTRLHSKVKEITKALDELIWTINPSYDTAEGLALYVSRLAQETITSAGLRCRLRIEDPPENLVLDSGVRHHLIMCLKEAIANAIKHSGCTQIEVMLGIEDGTLKLTVNDNGTGFSAPAPQAGIPADTDHSGCDNLRSRMEEIKGRLVLDSSAGKGTRICFEYPLSKR